MKNTKMIIALLLAATLNASAATSSVSLMLNNYYRDQAIKQLEFSLPRGKFNVQTEIKINENKAKAENEFGSVKLPMGASFVSGNELRASGAINTNIERMISYVEKIEISVAVAPSIPEGMREILKGSLVTSLGLDSKRGDQVKVVDLPEAYNSVWATTNTYESLQKPLTIAGAVIAFLFLMATGIIFLGFRQVSSRLEAEARNLSSTLKDALENSGTGGGMNKGGASAMMGAIAKEAAFHKEEAFENTHAAFWEKVDVDTLSAFCFDCIDHAKYSSVPAILISNILDPAKSAELEKKIPAVAYQNVHIDHSIKSAEITSLFQKNQSEYRRSMRSPMSRQIIGVPMAQIVEFSGTLQQMEIALLINSLSPLRRAALLKVLPTSAKMDLAEAAKKNISAVEHKALELSFTEKTSKLVTIVDRADDHLSMDYLTSIILKADTFAEDESIFNHVKSQGQSDYLSVLKAFEVFSKEDWENMNLQELATAFSGYSQECKEQLIGQYSGKKVEWLKNFLSKYEEKAPDFHSASVESVQENIKEMIKVKIAEANESQKRAG